MKSAWRPNAFSNYELYLRKVFWVGESLSWLLARELQPGPQRSTHKHQNNAPIFTAETVFYLPGTIDIKLLEQVKKARRGGREHDLTRRCMVRGHWRRAQQGWEDQRSRWVRPHWRGPSAAAIIERQYRLEE